MKCLLLAAVMLVTLQAGQAAQKREVIKRLVQAHGNLDDLVNDMHLGQGSSFLESTEAGTAKGNKRRKLCQTYEGLQVVGATADVEVSSSGEFRGYVSGHLAFDILEDIPDSSACQRSTPELVAKSKEYMASLFGLTVTDDMAVEQLTVERQVFIERQQDQAKLVYEVGFLIELVPTPSRPLIVMDACDPELGVIVHFDRINNMTMAMNERREEMRARRQEEECDTTQAPLPTTSSTGPCPASKPAVGEGGNEKMGRTVYGADRPFCLSTQVSGDTCIMDSRYAKVIDLETGTSDFGKTPVEFTCSEGYSDAINGAYGVANDAFYFGYSTGQLYEDWYGFFALGYTPKLRVHYGVCYQNAFWDGSTLTFGDGCRSLYPLVSQDVVAHELGHGITNRNSDLYYGGQSGGINEAFSDMSGEVGELFSQGSNDWEVGRELFKGNQALRYFETPSRDGRSIDSANDYTDGLDVHYSSGVFNRAFWQLVNVQNIGLRQAYEIFLQANRVVWGRSTNFQDGACGAMKSAYDLGYSVTAVLNAFAVVDIDLSSCQYDSFAQSIAEGESRQDVKVSSLRHPVFALDVSVGSTAIIDTMSESFLEVTVSVTSDAAGDNVIISGATPFEFEVTAETAFFKISATKDDDSTVELSLVVV